MVMLELFSVVALFSVALFSSEGPQAVIAIVEEKRSARKRCLYMCGYHPISACKVRLLPGPFVLEP